MSQTQLLTLIFSLIAAFAASLIAGYLLIPLLKRIKAGQQIREDGPQSHSVKAGTPTMGGLIFVVGIAAAMLVFSDQVTEFGWVALLSALAFSLIGLIDDIIIVLKRRSEGLKPLQKVSIQIIVSAAIAFYCYQNPAIGSVIAVPFTDLTIDLGFFYIPFVMIVLIGYTNFVNFTDGLDGLASNVAVINAATFTIIFAGLVVSAASPSMMIFCAATVGALLAFLRFNTYPAKVFMGDTGSFFLGGALAMIAIIPGQTLILPIVGVMFMVSGLSAIIQVFYFKITKGKRIFKMAPLHHHFELSGMPETKIVSMYSIATTIACVIALLAFR